MMQASVRKGEKSDISGALKLIKELAEYERQADAVICTEESMLKDGFGENPLFEFFVAEHETEIVGIALYYYKYSTWKGKCLFLEDIVISEQHRQKGIGSQLFLRVMELAKSQNLARMEWQVLDWNESAIEFYKKHKAIIDDEWLNVKYEWR